MKAVSSSAENVMPALVAAFNAAYEVEWDRVAELAEGSAASGAADRAATEAGIRAAFAEADRTGQQLGVCPECKGSCRTGSGYLREDCPACNGTGQQPAQPATDERGRPMTYWGGQPAQPDYDPIAAVEAVEHYEASAKALDALDSLDAQPGSGEAVGRFTADYIADVTKELESRGWQPDSRGDPDCVDEASAAGADIIKALQSALTAAQQRNHELQMLAWKWMEAHDKLKAGEPYSFPSPADLPTAQQRIAALHASLRTYGWHKPECDYMQDELPCTCGFMDAIKGRPIGPLPGGEG